MTSEVLVMAFLQVLANVMLLLVSLICSQGKKGIVFQQGERYLESVEVVAAVKCWLRIQCG